ncbi:hypothetical protein V5799_018495 [Amblyomma americanum]|uniref:Ig-like domain-containing protein n=1 Tax=Amblyomma americanum TaxID=6943 RepID=A0AAQ4EZB6_AMBAM
MRQTRITLILGFAQALVTSGCCMAGRPEIMPFSFSKNIVLGQKTTVTCVVSSGTGPFRFEWKHGERRVASDSRKNVLTLAENVAALTIEAITAEDLGNYTCTVASDVGNASYSAVLAAEDKPRIQPLAFPEVVNLGEEVSVTCAAASGRKPFRFTWAKDGKPLVDSKTKYSRTVLDNVAMMTIESVGAEDVGNYTCTASNRFGSDTATAPLVVDVNRATLKRSETQESRALGTSSQNLKWKGQVIAVAFCTLLALVTSLTSNSGPPAIMPFSFLRNVVLGQKTTVTCVVSSGTGPFHFVWSHGSETITSDSRKHVKVLAENVAALYIEAIGAEDLGNYTCTASNAAGKGSYSASLVVDAPPVIMPFSFAKDTSLGDRVLVSCVVTRGTAPFSISWTHQGRPIANTANKHATLLTGSIATMTIEKVAAEDVGNYTCTAKNAAGSDSFTAALTVEEKPKIQPFSFPKQHRLGKDITVSCFATEGQPPLSFAWSKDGAKIDNGKKFTIEHVAGKISTLAIHKVTGADVGNYTCTVSNSVGSDRFTAALLVTEAPRLQPLYIAKDHPLLETLVVSCIAIRGSRPLKFAWFKDGRPVAAGDRAVPQTLTETLSTLTIPKVTAEDVGNYTCQASNEAGSDSHTAELLVTAHCTVPKQQRKLVPASQMRGSSVHRLVTSSMTGAHNRIRLMTAFLVLGLLAGSHASTQDQPRIQPLAFPPNVNLGEKVSVTCVVVTGRKPFDFVWRQDGKVLANAKTKYSRVVVDNIVTMTIERVTAEDVGNYTCTVTNDFGSDSATAALIVEVMWRSILLILLCCFVIVARGSEDISTEKPKIQPFFFPKQHRLGKDITVSCFATEGKQPLEFAWSKDGVRIDSGGKYTVEHVGGKMSSLFVHQVSAADIGNYTCTATNDEGSDWFTAVLLVTAAQSTLPFRSPTTSFELVMLIALFFAMVATVAIRADAEAGAPRIHPFTFPKDHLPGQTVAVTCIVNRGTPPFSFSWLKDGRPLPTEGHKAVSRMITESVSVLTVPNVSAEDVGNYSCRATNAVGSDSFAAELWVTDQPRIQPLAFPPSVTLGEKVSVTCVAALGRKPFHFVWKQDGKVLVNGEGKYSRSVVDNVVMMTIERVAAEDVGNYTCTVTNDFGSDTATAALIVEELRTTPE